MPDEPEDARDPAPSDVRPYLAVGYDHRAGAPDGRAVSGLRPYLLTSGRTEPVDRTLELETQVLSTESGLAAYRRLPFERRDIVELCTSTRSVAEVGARLGLHVGVVRVLVADLAALGYLVVRRPSVPLSHDRKLIERVIRGLEAIR